MQTLKTAVVAGMLVFGAACGGPPPHPPAEQVATAVGDPVGALATAQLGPAGGTLTSADGQLTLTVPPGALATSTTLGVQALSNTAHGGVLSAWRLTPDGQTFTSPVTLTLSVPDGTLGSTPAGAMGFASQRADGFWKWETEASVDTTAHTATASVSHFSDWSAVKGFLMRPPFQQVKTGEAVNLIVAFCYSPSFGEGDLAALGYECDVEAADPDATPLLDTADVLAWKVNGVENGNSTLGTVAGARAAAVYTAPGTRPDPDTVTVSADIKWRSKGKLVATALVAIDPAQRKYQGNLRHVRSSTGQNITLAGDITWTETEGSQGTFVPTGRLSANITADGCVPYTGSIDVSGGSLYLDVPADGQYSFAVGFAQVMLSCNGQSTPYVFLDSIAPSCGEAAPSIVDPLKLTGSSMCTGSQLTWDFSRL